MATSTPPTVMLPGARAEPGDDLGELGLAVAGDGGDADDLAGADLERRRHAAPAGRGRCRPDTSSTDEHDRAGLERRPLESLEDLAADHQAGEVGLGGARRPGCPAAVTLPRRMTVIRSAIASTSSSLWLMNTTLRPAAVIDRSVRNSSSTSCGREDRRRLVHDQDPRAAVEHLEDLDPLLLADRQLPDLGARIDPQAELLGERARSRAS